MAKIAKITVQGTEIAVILEKKDDDYISLTDMARYKDNDPSAVISYWMKNHNTLEYLGAWEMLHNPDFKPMQMEGFRRELSLNAELIRQGVDRDKRRAILHSVVKHQLPLLNQQNADQRFRKMQETPKLIGTKQN